MSKCFEFLEDMVKELKAENERLRVDNINLREMYGISITKDEMEEMYKEYYSNSNNVIHI